MNFIDLTILIIAVLFTIRGLIRGFVLEVISIIGLLIGYVVAMLYLEHLAAILLSFFPSLPRSVVRILCFLALFIATNLVLKLLAQLLTKTLKLVLLGWLNRLLGAGIGLLKSLLLLSIVVFVLSFIPGFNALLTKADVQHSSYYPILNTLGPKFYHYLSQWIKAL